MGILEFFSTLANSNLTKKSIHNDIQEETDFDHLFIDFNSIVYVVYENVLDDINNCMYLCLKKFDKKQLILSEDIIETLKYYGIESMSELDPPNDYQTIIDYFKTAFDEDTMDNLMLRQVARRFIKIVKTFCSPKLKTLYIALDGIPSKGKLIEQRQRGIMGSLAGEFNKLITEDSKEYIKKLGEYYWIWLNNKVKWSRTKIKPNTNFMNKLALHLKSKQIGKILAEKFKNLKITVTDTMELGEAEMKIVRYINKYYTDSDDKFCIYSPDADVILLCMLLPVENSYYLKFDQQKLNYSLIDVNLLKIGIKNYIDINTDKNLGFDANRVIYDIVFLSTLFGNDFVPKIETINVRRGFELILFAYIETINDLYEKYSKKFHLVKYANDVYAINFSFFKRLIFKLSLIENDFIKNNNFYNTYLDAYMLRYVFEDFDIGINNVKEVLNKFREWYNLLQQKIYHKKKYDDIINNKYLTALSKCIVMNETNYAKKPTNILLSDLEEYYQKFQKFPEIIFKQLRTFNKSIYEKRYYNEISNKNKYEIQILKFEKLLDEYIDKFNGGPIIFKDSNTYYREYFENEDIENVCADYIEGIQWVFNYYFIDRDYINNWYYRHEKAPLLKNLNEYLGNINLKNFEYISKQLEMYKVDNAIEYFNPLEQLIYVSVYSPDTLKLLPKEYAEFYNSKIGSEFKTNLKEDAKLMWKEKKCSFLNCKGSAYFTKCINHKIKRMTYEEDEIFKKTIRKIKIDNKIIQKNTVRFPEY